MDVDALQLCVVQVEQGSRGAQDLWVNGQLRILVPISEGDFDADVEVVQ